MMCTEIGSNCHWEENQFLGACWWDGSGLASVTPKAVKSCQASEEAKLLLKLLLQEKQHEPYEKTR